jgi:hypothetical protein
VLGEYIGRIYDEVKRRPLFFIREVYRAEGRQTRPDQKAVSPEASAGNI